MQNRILSAREKTLQWLQTIQAPDAPQGVVRISALHDPKIWPGMLLPGTYNAVMLKDLLGALDTMPFDHRFQLANWFKLQRQANGIYKIQGMNRRCDL
jgi:hypothetical protein